MIPNFNMEDFVKKSVEMAKKDNEANNKKMTDNSIQSLSNTLVANSMPQNPNAAPIQQAPATGKNN